MHILLILILLVLPVSVFGDQEAVATDGTIVILRDDGTWGLKINQDELAKDSNKADDSNSGGDVSKGEKGEPSSFAVRNVRWGMTKAEVLKAEVIAPNREAPGELIYSHVEVVGRDVGLVYEFNEDGLLSDALYYFYGQFEDKTKYILEHIALQELLSEKYGEPIVNEVFWKDETYKEDPLKWGEAVSLGHVVLMHQWETLESEIFLTLEGEAGEIHLYIRYISKQYFQKPSAEHKQSNSLDDL